ncbi:chemotaxis protein CheC [Microcoleus vaginatus]|uniref:chemotaxis protein CheC n=1 Tax=Microcoleus TaxID=44471 RepID=UPI001F601DC1|nr:chemotaxis protein CheC [Microcoleus sp. HI-ES]MCZ0902598.1 chemotaxis protein CheC [Microcoleus sp. HI-ES]UNU27059.1 chemotaxis protein CheC [Microcoleus vaginatus HSN003]
MKLSTRQLDALQELVNIGIGQAAGVLNDMIDSPIRLQIPYLQILTPTDVEEELEQHLNGEQIAAVQLKFTGSFGGIAQLVFPTNSAALLVTMLTGEEVGTHDLDSVKIGTLSEVGNIVINGVMGAISNVLQQRLNYSIPTYSEGTIASLLISGGLATDTVVLLAQTSFMIERLHIEGDIILIFNVNSFDTLLTAINQLAGGL